MTLLGITGNKIHDKNNKMRYSLNEYEEYRDGLEKRSTDQIHI